MRYFIITIILVVALTNSVFAGTITETRAQLKTVSDSLEELINDAEKLKVREDSLISDNESLHVETKEIEQKLVKLAAEKSSLNDKLALLDSQMQTISDEFSEGNFHFSKVESSFKESFITVIEEKSGFWSSVLNFRSLTEAFRKWAFLDYLIFTESVAYAESRDSYQILSKEHEELYHKNKHYQEQYDIIASKQQNLEKELKVAQEQLSQNEEELTEISQELFQLINSIRINDNKASELEEILRNHVSESNFPVQRDTVLAWPLAIDGRITSDYGWRVHPIFQERSFHTGIDIAVESGTPIKAVANGTVIFSSDAGGYGLAVIIEHGDKLSSFYAHASKLLAREGQRVNRGEIIALVGNTGFSTGPHLHFEVREAGENVNPAIWLN